MLLDCAIIGGGPAGLNAALVLGRARRNVILFDNNKPRNRVTQESHGFITRDGVSPSEFRRIAHLELGKYDSVRIEPNKIVEVTRDMNAIFQLITETGIVFQARTIILATGLKEILPSINGIHDYYGKSLFSCPYCDGWELRDKPLMVLSENQHVFHMAKIVLNWSKQVMVCTNGIKNLTAEQIEVLNNKSIRVYEQKIKSFAGENGLVEKVIFNDGAEVEVKGGFITPQWLQASSIGESLGCPVNPLGGYLTDDFGRTAIQGIYAAGDTSVVAPAQLIIAAAEGSRAAIGVNSDLSQLDF